MSLRPGEVFAGYTVERELGAGGMGSVYLARHPRLPRFDALKLLRAELCADPGFVGRFEREADTVAQLDHPNIVPVYDRGSQDGQLWISMRFIDGTNAEKALADHEHGMAPERAVRIVGKVASALDYAHRHRLLHRDVKPANILLTPGPDDDPDHRGEESERVFLSDFGVAKAIGEAAERISSLTSTGSVVATLDYASPEQIKGQILDHRSDIYALGCVLYKLLTGTVPYPGDSVAARVYGHLNNVPPRPSGLVPALPSGFDEVVATAMAKEVDERYPTCRALALAARSALASPVGQAPPPRPDPDEGFPTIMTAAAGAGALTRPPGQPVRPVPQWLGGPPGTTPEQVPPEQVPPGQVPADRPRPEQPYPEQPHRDYRQPGPRHADQRPPEQHPDGYPVPRQLSPEHEPRDQQQGPVDRPPPSAAPAAVPAAAGGRPPAGRRALVIGGSVAAVVVVGAVVVALVLRGNVAGTASLGLGTSTPAHTSVSSTPPASSFPASSAAAVSSSAVPGTSAPGPVPGLPHSVPLAEQVLIGSRSVAGSSNLYQFDAVSGALGRQLTTGSPGTQFPILSPDRGSMIYVQTSPAGSTLRTAAVDGTADRELFTAMPADCATFYRPAWNPVDQTEIALPCVTAAGNIDVHLMGVDGAERGRFTSGLPIIDDLTYSPDGKTLAFWGSEAQGVEGTIFTRPADGSAPAKRLVQPVEGTGDADPSFSPDGTKIAFRRVLTDSAGQVTGARLFVVGADGSGLVALTDGASVDQDPIWSPDGSRLAFKSNRLNAAGTRDNQIWVIGADGTNPRELAIGSPGSGDGAPAWGHR